VNPEIDIVSFTRARKAQQTANLANGDVSSLLTQIASLQSQFTTLSNAHTILSNNFTALQNTYTTHTHPYTDVDNLGVTLNKTTGTKT
jgi:hypothetical protein